MRWRNRFDGGGGSDTVSYAGSSTGVIVDLLGQVTWDGTVNDTLSSIENAVGSSRNDALYGDAGNNVLDGGAGGADFISGDAGSGHGELCQFEHGRDHRPDGPDHLGRVAMTRCRASRMRSGRR